MKYYRPNNNEQPQQKCVAEEEREREKEWMILFAKSVVSSAFDIECDRSKLLRYAHIYCYLYKKKIRISWSNTYYSGKVYIQFELYELWHVRNGLAISFGEWVWNQNLYTNAIHERIGETNEAYEDGRIKQKKSTKLQ